MLSRILPGRRSTSQKASASVPSSPKPQHSGMKRLDNWIGNLLRDGVSSNSNNNNISKPIVTNRPPSILIQNNNGANVAPTASRNASGSTWIPSAARPTSSFNESLLARVQSPITLIDEQPSSENTCPPQPPRQAKPQSYRSPLNPYLPAGHPRENRANVLLQQLRADDGAQSESDVSVNEVNIMSNHSKSSAITIFLQYNDEVKRSHLPTNIRTVDQVKSLFLRSFPNLTPFYLNQPNVKVYIQESAKTQLFYELDDISEIKDKSILKIREQPTGYQSPPPIVFTDRPPTIADYVSEPENDDFRERNYRLTSSLRMRPASAIPGDNGRMYNPNNFQKLRSPASSVTGRYDPYYDPYASDTSSQGPRSGSVTPVIDKETRFRMDTMERQLAGLSTLVHSALVSKSASESTQKEIHDLRRQILDYHPEVGRFTPALDTTSELHNAPSSLADSTTSSSVVASPETQRELVCIKKALANTNADMCELKRSAQLNIQASHEIISNAFQKIQESIWMQQKEKRSGTLQQQQQTPTEEGITPVASVTPAEKSKIEGLKREHLSQSLELQNSLRTFEVNVENIRRSVLNSNRKLRMTEVEQLTNLLTKIGKQAAKLKTQFPELQTQVEKNIKQNMEQIVQEQKFIKNETAQIDNSLRRCKGLANMMITMKKLAMVQDPAINVQKLVGRDDRKPPKSPVNLGSKNYDNAYPPAALGKPPVPTSNGNGNGNANASDAQVPPIPPAPVNYAPPVAPPKPNGIGSADSGAHVLDAILDELNSTADDKVKRQNNNFAASFSVKVPPRPPERQESHETVKTYSSQVGIPPPPIQQTNAIFDNAASNSDLTRLSAISSSESINSQDGIKDRTAILQSNKECIDDKQRELNDQLEKLQQLCPTL